MPLTVLDNVPCSEMGGSKGSHQGPRTVRGGNGMKEAPPRALTEHSSAAATAATATATTATADPPAYHYHHHAATTTTATHHHRRATAACSATEATSEYPVTADTALAGARCPSPFTRSSTQDGWCLRMHWQRRQQQTRARRPAHQSAGGRRQQAALVLACPVTTV